MQKIRTFIIIVLIFLSNILFAQHLKKDGTPDRRYKENKTYSPQPGSNSTVHLKKDGTPDRRYKGNKNYSTPSSSTSRGYTYSTTTKRKKATYYFRSIKRNANGEVKRDANGKIHRSQSARVAFMKMTGYPHGRPGYIIDHIIPLKRGGCDCPSNMQWQTIQEAKEKDKVEEP